MMDFFQNPYYRTCKILMLTTGQWPYQTTRTRRVIIAIVVVLFTCQIGPQALATFKYRADPEILIESVSPLMFLLLCSVKSINCILHSKQVINLLDRIRKNWEIWADDQEVKILHDYTDKGRIFSIVYAVSIYSTTLLFMTQPLLPKIIDTLFKNGSEPGVFPFPVFYGPIDEQKYYAYVIAFSYMCVTMIGFSMIAADLLFIASVVHGCGIFAAVGNKLKRVGANNRVTESENSTQGRDSDVDHLALCIDRHNDALEFATIIEEIHTWCFFFVVGFNMLMLSVTGFQIVTKTNEPQDTIRYIAFVGAQMSHLYLLSLLSQILMDHSADIRYCLYDSKWYNISHKARKLLNVITMRCNIPCQLTAGKVCIMSVPTFGVVVRSSMSYFTILRSME